MVVYVRVCYALLGANLAMAWATYQMDMPAFTAANLMASLMMATFIYWDDFDA